jgi:hypothetical protein
MNTICKSIIALFVGIYSTGNYAAKLDMFLPTYQCTLTKQRHVYDISNVGTQSFITSTPEIYLICESDNVVKGDNFRAVWIADNTSQQGWDNYKIAEHMVVVRKDLNDLDLFKTTFKLRKPHGGWPAGSYHVRVYINGVEGYGYQFSIR